VTTPALDKLAERLPDVKKAVKWAEYDRQAHDNQVYLMSAWDIVLDALAACAAEVARLEADRDEWRELHQSCIKTRNNACAKRDELSDKYVQMKQRAEQADDELAALKAQGCDSCIYRDHWPEEGPTRLSEMPLACTACFGSSSWAAREEASDDGT
jgi:hypothetical protein